MTVRMRFVPGSLRAWLACILHYNSKKQPWPDHDATYAQSTSTKRQVEVCGVFERKFTLKSRLSDAVEYLLGGGVRPALRALPCEATRLLFEQALQHITQHWLSMTIQDAAI